MFSLFLLNLMKYFHLFFALGYFSVLCLLLLNYALFYVYKVKFKIHTYKITNVYFSFFCFLVYISFFIFYIILLRVLRMGKYVDLPKIFMMLFEFDTKSLSLFKILFGINVGILVLLLWLLIFFRLRPYLFYQIKKIHLFFKASIILEKNSKKLTTIRIIYSDLYSKISFKYTYNTIITQSCFFIYKQYETFCKRFFPKKHKKLLELFFKNILIYQQQVKLYTFLRYFMFVILIVLFCYDCYFNGFIIEKVFYYLPIYAVFLLWYNISFFIYNTDIYFNNILFEMYYCQPEILYVNLTDEEENELNNYITQGLQNYKKSLITPIISTHPIIQKRQFIQCDKNTIYSFEIPENTLVYYNPNLGLGAYFYKEDLIIIDGKYYVNEN